MKKIDMLRKVNKEQRKALVWMKIALKATEISGKHELKAKTYLDKYSELVNKEAEEAISKGA